MKRRTRLALVVVLLGIALAATWAWRTARGTDGLALMRDMLLRYLPALALEDVAGTIEQGRIARLAWRARSVQIELRGIDWQLDPSCLGSITVCFERLSVAALDIDLLGDGDGGDGSQLDLAAVELPFALRLRAGTLGTLAVHRGEREYLRIDGIALDAAMNGSIVEIDRLRARIERWRLATELAGRVDLREQLPLEAAGRVTWNDSISATASARGDLGRLGVRARGEGAYPLDGEGWIEPLGDGAPLEFALRSRERFAPLPEQREWAELDEATLALSGTVQRLAARLEAALHSKPLGENRVTARATLEDARLTLERFELAGERGVVQANGALALDAGQRWTLEAQLADFVVPQLPEAMRARLSGPVTLSGAIAGAEPLFDARLGLDGTINDYPAKLAGRVVLDRTQAFALEQLELVSGPNRLQVDGRIADTLALQGTLSIQDLAATLTGAGGRGTGELGVSGTRANPELHARLQLDKLAWSGLAVDSMTAQAAWFGGASDANRVQVDARALRYGAQALDSAMLTLAGSTLAHALSARANGEPVALALDCTGSLAGSGDWNGRCQRVDAERTVDGATWRLDKSFALDWNAGTQTFGIAPFCLHERGASLCSSKRAEIARAQWRGIELRARSLPVAALRSWMPPALNPDGVLDLELDIVRPAGAAPRIEARLASQLIALAPQAAGEPLPLAFSDISASLHAASGEATLAWQSLVGADGHTSGTLTLRGRDASAAIEGTLELEAIDVGQLLRVVPGTVRAEGRVDGHIVVAGTAADPQLAGRLALRDGAFAHERLPQPIDAFSLAVAFTGPDASIGGQFTSAAGTGEIKGIASWHERDWKARLQLEAAQLVLEPLRGSTLTLVPKLRVELSPQHAAIRGVVRVPAATIDLERVPQTAARVSDDTVIEGETVAQERFDYSLNLNLKLGDDVRFKGFGAEAKLGGSVRLRKQPGNPIGGTGEVRIVEGRYAAYGQRLEVRDGALLFRGALDRPELRIDATRPIEDERVTVGVRVRGDARAPELSVYSQPPMEENRAMVYLLTGRAPESGSGGNAGASALMALGAARANRLTTETIGKLGIEDFQVDTRAVEGGTEVHLSGYITPDLYLRYGVSSFEAVNTFRLRYRLTPKFFVEALSGVENAVDFLYSFER